MTDKKKDETSGKELAVKSVTSQPVALNVTNATLEKLQKKFAKVPDCTTTKGYELARVGISEIVGLRTGLAACKKDRKAEAIAFGKKVDVEYNRILDILVGIETPMKEAKKAVDAEKEAKKEEKRKAEENRKFKITNRINMIREIIFGVIDKSSEEIKKQLDVVKEIEINKNDFEEFTTEAERARIDAEVKLEELHQKAVEREEAEVERKAEEDRIAEERKNLEEEQAIEASAREEREKKETEEREAREKEEAIKRAEEAAELAAKEEELRKKQEDLDERERKADEEREATAEKERLAAEAKDKEKKDKANEEANEALQLEKYNESLAAIELLIGDKKISKAVLDAVMDGAIPNLTYN